MLWLATSLVTGHHEAWDADAYWSLTYPLSIATGGGLGYWAPRSAWRWGLGVMWGQLAVLLLTASGFSLLPLGLLLFSLLALPPIGAAVLMARLKLRRGHGGVG